MNTKKIAFIQKVILSCKTKEQLDNAHQWGLNITEKYSEREAVHEACIHKIINLVRK